MTGVPFLFLFSFGAGISLKSQRGRPTAPGRGLTPERLCHDAVCQDRIGCPAGEAVGGLGNDLRSV